MQVAGLADEKVEAEVQQLREDCAQLQFSQVPDSVFAQVRAKEAEMVAKAEALKKDAAKTLEAKAKECAQPG
eukprot:2509895-Karenia_brevis.AAC.1